MHRRQKADLKRQQKRRNKTNKTKHNQVTGRYSERLLQRWPKMRSWWPNPMRIGRRKPATKGMTPRDRRY